MKICKLRAAAGLFDVSHMGQGPSLAGEKMRRRTLEQLTPAADIIGPLKEGQMRTPAAEDEGWDSRMFHGGANHWRARALSGGE